MLDEVYKIISIPPATRCVDHDNGKRHVLTSLCYCWLFVYFYFGQYRRHITKTCLYNFDPLKPHFCIVKLGFTGVYIIFLISSKNIDCGYSLEPPRLCFEQKYEKYQNFSSEKFHFLVVKFSVYLNRRVFVIKSLVFVIVLYLPICEMYEALLGWGSMFPFP